MQEIIKVYISNDVTQISKMMNLHTHLVIQRKKSQNLSLINMDDAEYANLTTAEKSNLSHWNDLEWKHWGKHRLLYIPNMRCKLINSKMLGIVHSHVEICSRVPQACRKNAVFLINTISIKDLDHLKSDLNGEVDRIQVEDG